MRERLAIKSLINKWIIMLCVGLFFPHRNDRNGHQLYRIDPSCAHLFFRHLFLNISVLSQNLKLGVIKTIVQNLVSTLTLIEV